MLHAENSANAAPLSPPVTAHQVVRKSGNGTPLSQDFSIVHVGSQREHTLRRTHSSQDISGSPQDRGESCSPPHTPHFTYAETSASFPFSRSQSSRFTGRPKGFSTQDSMSRPLLSQFRSSRGRTSGALDMGDFEASLDSYALPAPVTPVGPRPTFGAPTSIAWQTPHRDTIALPPTPRKSFPASAVPRKPNKPPSFDPFKSKRTRSENKLAFHRIQGLQMDEGSQESLPLPPAALSQGILPSQNEGFSQGFSQTQFGSALYHGYHADFHEIEMVGSGSFGKVYIVERKFDAQRFAVKQVCEALCGSSDRTRKLMEVRAMGIACRGPHVVRLHHTWAEGDPSQQTMYILMELCPGGSLGRRARTRTPPDEIEALDILGQLTLALHTCHSQQIAHGDLKLENVLYDEAGRLKLGDFGHAVFLDATTGHPISYRQYELSHNHQHIWSSRENTEAFFSQEDGDARYIALDMLNERMFYMSGDIFALGMCMYELMSGTLLPKNGEEHTALRTTDLVKRTLAATKKYSVDLVVLIFSLIHPDPTKRPTAQELMCREIFPKRRSDLLAQGSDRRQMTGDTSLSQLSFLQTVSEIEFLLLETKRRELRERLLPVLSKAPSVVEASSQSKERSPQVSGSTDTLPSTVSATYSTNKPTSSSIRCPRPTVASILHRCDEVLRNSEKVMKDYPQVVARDESEKALPTPGATREVSSVFLSETLTDSESSNSNTFPVCCPIQA